MQLQVSSKLGLEVIGSSSKLQCGVSRNQLISWATYYEKIRSRWDIVIDLFSNSAFSRYGTVCFGFRNPRRKDQR